MATIAHSGSPTLMISWPASWEHNATETSQAVLTVTGETHTDVDGPLLLKLTAINISAAPNPITAASVKQLAGQLRDHAAKTAVEAELPLVALEKAGGYYFTATDKDYRPGEFKQMIEGVILNSDYLINFTVFTNSATSTESQSILMALDALEIR
jgi:hypothetical protein